jgi:hypothetical protein
MIASVMGMAAAMTTFISTTVFASPTDHCFGVNQATVSYYDSLKGVTYQLPSLDTYDVTNGASQINTKLNNIGYYNAYSYQNNSASIQQSVIGSDAIFYVSSHGDAGRIFCVDGSTSSANVTLLTANATSNNSAYSLQN